MIQRYDVRFEPSEDTNCGWVETHVQKGDGLFVFASDALLLECEIIEKDKKIEQLENDNMWLQDYYQTDQALKQII